MNRRTFLELLGVVGAAAACNGAPPETISSYLRPPEGITPGVSTWYASVCRACSAGCGILARTREARPVKLEGNPLHPINGGRLCARGQAWIQGLYTPDRIRVPLLRREGRLEEVTWEQAMAELGQRLAPNARIGLLTRLESGAFESLVTDLASAMDLRHASFEPISYSPLAAASRLLFGREEVPLVDLADVDFVLSLGADFLDAWLSPVQLSGQWAQRHGFDQAGRTLILEYAGPRRNLTANAADTWHRVPVAQIGSLAAKLLAGVFEARKGSLEPGLAAVAETAVRQIAGVGSSEEVAPLVRRLLSAQRPLVLHGGIEDLQEGATSVTAAVLLLDHLLGATRGPLRYGANYALSKASPSRNAIGLAAQAASGEIDALFVWGANPVHDFPGDLGRRTLEAAPLVVAMASELDETTDKAHFVLPVHHGLESWGDYVVADGIEGIVQPARMPRFDSRHPADVLLDLAVLLGKTTKYPAFRDYLAERWVSSDRMERALAQGGAFDVEPLVRFPKPALDVELLADELSQIPPVRTAVPLVGHATLVVAASAAMHDGRFSNRSWLLETPDSLTQTSWEVPIEVSSDVAMARGITTGDRVRLSGSSLQRSIETVALVDPDMAAGTVALRLGGGRTFIPQEPDYGAGFSVDRSVVTGNVLEILDAFLDPPSGALLLSGTGVTLERVHPGLITRVSGSDVSTDRYLCLAMEARDALAGRYPVMTHEGERQASEAGKDDVPLDMPAHDLATEGERPAQNFYELSKHPEHRWGLVVDLDRCTGCGACVVACTAENNVAVIGPKEVRRNRLQTWIRIEKHVFDNERSLASGSSDSPGSDTHQRPSRVRFLPVMCQHCSQAPCETVCPVFAAYHTPDGLNAQIYNRCIGTRYCANNCPYKVRRFNYFDWAREAPEQLNPDVSVRGRGVMEKCTLCIQRIREATNRAKVDGRKVKDGEIVPACAQTCPTGALTFGDLKDPTSQVSRKAAQPRGYRLLDWLVNTRPGVVYLRKVYSNPEDV
jgi:Fe-S-cluster-containing dehydrogenase component/anaerobic selenocysteine-containing dehydrogenase